MPGQIAVPPPWGPLRPPLPPVDNQPIPSTKFYGPNWQIRMRKRKERGRRRDGADAKMPTGRCLCSACASAVLSPPRDNHCSFPPFPCAVCAWTCLLTVGPLLYQLLNVTSSQFDGLSVVPPPSLSPIVRIHFHPFPDLWITNFPALDHFHPQASFNSARTQPKQWPQNPWD